MSCVESLNFFFLDMNMAAVRACGHSLRFMRHAPFPGIRRSVGGDGLWETSLDASLKIPSQNLGGMMEQGQTFGFMDALSVTIPKTLNNRSSTRARDGASVCNMHNINMPLSLVSLITCAHISIAS